MQPYRVIDAHHHLWSLEDGQYTWLQKPPAGPTMLGDYAAIRHTYSTDDYLDDSHSLQLVGAVQVEAGSDDPIGEARWLDAQTAALGVPATVVAACRLEEPNAEEALASHAALEHVRGIRQMLNWHRQPVFRATERDLLDDEDWRRGFALLERYCLSFDLQVLPNQLEAAARLARDFPTTLLVLNHGAMVGLDDLVDRAERSVGLRRLAATENVVVKISGFGINRTNRSSSAMERWFDELIEVFGPDRCMLGSDFPVDKLYTQGNPLVDLCRLASRLSPDEDRAVRIGTAARVYRIGVLEVA
jgi:predicted TIM-barrel fold metal-dependent hydrolase